MQPAFILGIESSCDETAAAVVRSGEELVSNVVASQIATHQPYGGVVPELASREHLRAIVPVVRQALAEAGKTYESIDAIAVTQGPGLAGALLVGISYAKALAFALEKPLITVNHLEGHIHAVLLEEKQKGNFEIQFPLLALVVSGGHTHLFLAEQRERGWTYANIGRTRDDAAGEAYDKVAKLLGLGYPGGPVIDGLAKTGNDRAYNFPLPRMTHADRNQPAPTAPAGLLPPSVERRLDFSFSGLKTAVARVVAELRSPASELDPRVVADIAASFQRTVVQALLDRSFEAAAWLGAKSLGIAGGVSANSRLRADAEARGAKAGLPVFVPPLSLSTDNAAMIGAAAMRRLRPGASAEWDLKPEASLVLESVRRPITDNR